MQILKKSALDRTWWGRERKHPFHLLSFSGFVSIWVGLKLLDWRNDRRCFEHQFDLHKIIEHLCRKMEAGSAKLEASLLNFGVRAHWTSKTLCYDLRKGFKKLWFSDYCFEIMNSTEASFSYSSSVPMTSHTVRFFDKVGSWSMQRKSSFSISVNTPTRNWLTKVLASWDNYLTLFQSFADYCFIYIAGRGGHCSLLKSQWMTWTKICIY